MSLLLTPSVGRSPPRRSRPGTAARAGGLPSTPPGTGRRPVWTAHTSRLLAPRGPARIRRRRTPHTDRKEVTDSTRAAHRPPPRRHPPRRSFDGVRQIFSLSDPGGGLPAPLSTLPLETGEPLPDPPANWGSSPILVFFNDPATTEIYTLSLHDALPI